MVNHMTQYLLIAHRHHVQPTSEPWNHSDLSRLPVCRHGRLQSCIKIRSCPDTENPIGLRSNTAIASAGSPPEDRKVNQGHTKNLTSVSDIYFLSFISPRVIACTPGLNYRSCSSSQLLFSTCPS